MICVNLSHLVSNSENLQEGKIIALVVHGGAWDVSDEMVETHHENCCKVPLEGWRILEHGGSAVDVVNVTIKVFEDDPTFDAGRGSFVNALGEIELDSSIMNGTTFRRGSYRGKCETFAI